MAPSHEIFFTIENILKSPFTLAALGIAISSLVLYYAFASKSPKSRRVRSKNSNKPPSKQQQRSTATKKSSESRKGASTTKQNSVAKSTSDKGKKEQQSKQQVNKKNKEAETKKKESGKKQEADTKKVSQQEKKIKVAEANPRLNDRSQNKDEGGWIKLVSRREKRERSAKLKELRAEQGEKVEAVKKPGEKKPYRGQEGNKKSTPFQKRT